MMVDKTVDMVVVQIKSSQFRLKVNGLLIEQEFYLNLIILEYFRQIETVK